MYLFHWFGNVWELGDADDYLSMLFVKLILLCIVLAIGLAVLVPWLAFKIIQWKPVVGVPLVLGLLAIGGIMVASSN
jgi:hypothetical protein